MHPGFGMNPAFFLENNEMDPSGTILQQMAAKGGGSVVGSVQNS
jgi:hypothetical protein